MGKKGPKLAQSMRFFYTIQYMAPNMQVESEISLKSTGKNILQIFFLLLKLQHLYFFSQKFFFQSLNFDNIFQSLEDRQLFFHGPQYAGSEFLRFLEMYLRYRYKILTIVWDYNLKDYEHKYSRKNLHCIPWSSKCRFVAPNMQVYLK